jgi:tripartite-type tricarboxylate transporter receptor subunit TctC
MCGDHWEVRTQGVRDVSWLCRSARSAVFACPLLTAHAAWAQLSEPSFPSRPLRVIVPYPAGGLADIFARALAAASIESFGQQIIIENRPGATQIIGAQAAAKAAPDGYTLFFGSVTSLAINPASRANLPYDPLRDFTPVTFCFSTPLYLVVHNAVPARSVKELIALARAQPGKLTFASGGPGTSQHLAGELFKSMARLDLTHVPYKGAAPAMEDVQAGQVNLMFEGGGLHYLRDGKIRVLAVTSAKRTTSAPDIATVHEAGVPGFESTIWFGLTAPAATPRAHIDALSAKFGGVLERSALQQKFPALDISRSTPEQFTARIRAEIPKWRKVIQDANVVIE